MENTCELCGAALKDSRESLHIWEDEYECGTITWGPIDGSNEYEFRTRCK